MKNKFKQHACDFKNPSECKEELEEIGIDPVLQEKEAFEEEISQKNNNPLKRDEDNYEALIEKGIDKNKAAHIVNRIAEKRLKY